MREELRGDDARSSSNCARAHAGSLTIACVGVGGAELCHARARAISPRAAANTRIEALIMPDHAGRRLGGAQRGRLRPHSPARRQPVPRRRGDLRGAGGVRDAAASIRSPTRRTLTRARPADVPLISFREDTDIGFLLRRALTDGGRPAARARHRHQPVAAGDRSRARGRGRGGRGSVLAARVARRFRVAVVPFRPAIPNRLRIIRGRERPRSQLGAHLARVVQDVVRERTAGSPLRRLFRTEQLAARA